MATVQTAWLSPGTVTQVTKPGGSWTNPSSIGASDNSYATASVTGWLVEGPVLLASNFNFNIPAGCTVTHVELSVEGFYTLSGGATAADYEAYPLNMYKDVATYGTSSGGWPTHNSLSGTTEAVRNSSPIDVGSVTSNGSALSTWTVSDWNASTCGLLLPAIGTTSNFDTGGTVSQSVDAVRIRLTYTDPNALGSYSNTATATQSYTLTVPGVSFVGSATGTTSATLPAHQANDLILIFAYRDGNNTAPSLPAGYTSINSGGANTNSSRLGYKIATSSSETSGTWTNATSVIAHVYRGVDTANPIGGNGIGGASSTTVTYPAVTMVKTDGSSVVAGFAGHTSVNTTLETAPAGMTARSTVVDATDEAAGFDTNGGVSSWSATAVSVGGTSSGWRAQTVEIRRAIILTPLGSYSNTGTGSQTYKAGYQATDPYWSNVVSLNRFNTSGTTVTDLITSNTWSTVGTGVTQSTSAPIFGSGSLTITDTTSNLVTTTTPANFNFGTGDFTVELALEFNPSQTVTWPVPIEFAHSTDIVWQFYFDNYGGSSPYMSFWSPGGAVAGDYHASLKAWEMPGVHYLAYSRVSGVGYLYFDGTRIATGTDTVNYTGGTQLLVGREFNGDNGVPGKYDEIRITKGVGRYTGSSYTVQSAEWWTPSNVSLSYSNTGTGSNTYALKANASLAYSNTGTGSSTYAATYSTRLAYSNSGTGTNSYTPVFKASLAYLNAGTGTTSYSLSAVTSLAYSNSGTGAQSYKLSGGSAVSFSYSNTGLGSQSYKLTVEEQPIPVAPVGGAYPSNITKWDALTGAHKDDPETSEPADVDSIIKIEPTPLVITVEADPSKVANLIDTLAPKIEVKPDLEMLALREAMALMQLQRHQQEEEAAAMLLMQVAVRRRRSFLRR